ncbi:MAG: D-alanine--D-alanine ligase [Deltaproteobacteria bacterium]|nr:D-alanine--D-alanine ligase [Deltaproteobacteria bacterium]
MNVEKRIGVLYGGMSSERDVSLRTGKAVHDALSRHGRNSVLIDVGRDVGGKLLQEKVEVAFVALHGRWGEDGCIQGLLECMGIPYTGSGVLASGLAMDKVLTRVLMPRAGVPMPAGLEVPAAEAEQVTLARIPFGVPCVVKPSREGSSVGVSLVKKAEDLPAALTEAAKHGHHTIVEQYVKGRECSVAVLFGKSLGVVEIEPADEFYSYKAKYGNIGTRYHYPARIPADVARKLMELGARAHAALGCDGASRADFLVTEAGEPFLLEVNTLPGMTEASLLPKIAAGEGISFTELCERLVNGASLKA